MQHYAARLVTHTRIGGTHNTSFVPAALASCTFQITVQDPVSPRYLSDLIETIYASENPPIWVLFTLEGTKSHTAMYGERSFRTSSPRLWNELLNQIKLPANKTIFHKVLKTHLWCIYNLYNGLLYMKWNCAIWAQNMF